jgi:hypothetical protein
MEKRAGNSISFLQRELNQSFWGDLFHGFDLSKTIHISLQGTGQHSRSLRIYASNKEIRLPLSTEEDSAKNTGGAYAPVTFEWQRPGGEPVVVTPQLQGGNILLPPTPDSNIKCGILRGAGSDFLARKCGVLF